ncbi:MAG TPA: hypothetical protein VGM67_18735 [Gemmatimonadaceae bacterium]|jgi:hypothetical protein
MMMAHDSSPGDGSLDDETISALRSALTEYVATPADGERLRVALHAMACEARQKGMLPERLLVVLKDVWYAVPSIRLLKEPDDQTRLLQRIVTMCIKEYYSE